MRLFLNYRREDSIGYAGRLTDSLESAFGRGSVSRYVDEPEAGDASERSAAQQLAAIDAVLVMIGPHWLAAGHDDGQRMLDRDDDFVRLHIEAALAANKTVIAVLVDGATMPDEADLPASIADLARCEALALDDATWAADVARLAARLRPSMPVPVRAAMPLSPDNTSAWMITGGLLAVVFLLGAFLLTSRFWLDEPPPVVGVWVADVSYDDDRTYRERFEFRLTGGELSGSASYQGIRRVIESGRLEGDQVDFLVRTRERRGHQQLELRHRYVGTVSNSRIDFALETSGDVVDRGSIEFEARPAAD